eukprot:5275198-Amphidinium_carterae.1
MQVRSVAQSCWSIGKIAPQANELLPLLMPLALRAASLQLTRNAFDVPQILWGLGLASTSSPSEGLGPELIE